MIRGFNVSQLESYELDPARVFCNEKGTPTGNDKKPIRKKITYKRHMLTISRMSTWL